MMPSRQADLNADGKITYTDLGLLRRYLGT